MKDEVFIFAVGLVLALAIIVPQMIEHLYLKRCVERGIKSNVYCLIPKEDSCSNYGWWGGVCGNIEDCKFLGEKTNIPCYELERSH